MKWRGRRTSSNVEDARGRRVTAGGAGATALLSLVGRSFGWKGILVVIVLGLIGWKMGLIDPSALTARSISVYASIARPPDSQPRR